MVGNCSDYTVSIFGKRVTVRHYEQTYRWDPRGNLLRLVLTSNADAVEDLIQDFTIAQP